MNHPLPPPLRHTTFRLARPRDGLVALPDLGPLYVQVRGTGGGLGKAVDFVLPISVEGLDFAFDPDAGVGFSMRDLEAVHASAPDPSSYFEGSLEFEFRGFPHGMGLHLLPDEVGLRRNGIADLLTSVPTKGLKDGELERWREDRRQAAPMCPCCRERAKIRSRFPEDHPLHTILHHSLANGIQLHWRLIDHHAELSTSFTAARIEAREGFLVASDAPARHAVHVDMARLHAFAIQTRRLDGVDYSKIRLFESRGQVTFEILAEDPSLAPLWCRFCEPPSR
jgi:hypothetical protein